MSDRSSDRARAVWLRADSLAHLLRHEREIIERIERTPNGTQLFLIHPFLLLDQIGVSLSARAREEILRNEPDLTGLSALPYNALKRSTSKQKVRIHLQGLFKPRETR